MFYLRLPGRILCLLLVLAGPAMRADGGIKQLESPLEIAPFPAVIAYAAKHQIPIEGVELAGDSSVAKAGDAIVYLLTLQQRAGRKQWLVRIVSGTTDPAKGDARTLPDDTLFTSTGLELHYANTPAALDVEFIGPFDSSATGGAQAAVSRGRAIVSAESLQVGLAGYCQSALVVAARLKAAGIDNPAYTGSGSRPKPDVVEAGRKAAAAFGLTADEERMAFSVYFALRTFYQACSGIPACRDVLEQVIQKPSLWSVASNVGLSMGFEYGWHRVQPLAADQAPVSAPAYLLPVNLSVNGKPALYAALLGTTTQPPLRTCAGIFALAATHPTDDSKRVYLRVLSARLAKR